MGLPLRKKLQLKSEHQSLVLNPPEGYISSLGSDKGTIATEARPEELYGFVQLFVEDQTTLDRLRPKTLAALANDAIFWICYPKKSSKVTSDLSRDVLRKLMQDSGLRPVMQISIDETWSALRFRPEERVGK